VLTLALLAFSSIDEAAVAALTAAKYHCETRYECGGYIYKTPAGYEYTYPVTSGKPNAVDLGAVYRLNWDWVADYHTHACVGVRQLNEVFSMQDVLANKGLHLPGYMLSLCSGYVRRWAEGDPEDDFEVDYHSGRKLFLATGHIVGIVL
jgi:hypothetical protein